MPSAARIEPFQALNLPHAREPLQSFRSGRPQSRDAAEGLQRIGQTRVLKRGQELYAEGDPSDHYYKVVAGAARLCRLLPDGRRQVIEFLVAGDYFGFGSFGSYGATAEAITDCTVISYPRRAVEALIEREPRLGRSLLEMVSRSLSAVQDQLLLLGRKTPLERLATFLLAMARRAEHGTARQFDLVMTRADIADHLGLTMETVSRCLTRLRRMGIIALPSKAHVVLLQPDALERLQEDGALEEAIPGCAHARQ